MRERLQGLDVIYGASSNDTLDLSGYAEASVAQSRVGNDLRIDLG